MGEADESETPIRNELSAIYQLTGQSKRKRYWEIVEKIADLERENARLRGELEWTKQELIEVMRIVGAPDGTDDDITRLIKLTAIRRMVEADEERYLELVKRTQK